MTDTANLIERGDAFPEVLFWKGRAAAATIRAEAAEAERDALRGLLQTDERIEAENRQLREALERIERWCDGEGDEFGRMLARAALDGSSEQPT